MNTTKTEAKDPSCGMTVDTTTALHAEHDGETSYFCREQGSPVAAVGKASPATALLVPAIFPDETLVQNDLSIWTIIVMKDTQSLTERVGHSLVLTEWTTISINQAGSL